MDINYLQKLDLLLKVANKNSAGTNYKIVFGLNGQTYTGDFFVEVSDSKATLLEFDCKCEISKSKIGFKQGTGIYDIHVSDEMDCISYQNEHITAPSAYLQLLKSKFDIDNLELSKKIPPYIFNVKNLTSNIVLPFFELDNNTQFDFISIIPEK